jgi:hypothetical protein
MNSNSCLLNQQRSNVFQVNGGYKTDHDLLPSIPFQFIIPSRPPI